jgi:hypothetical protein
MFVFKQLFTFFKACCFVKRGFYKGQSDFIKFGLGCILMFQLRLKPVRHFVIEQHLLDTIAGKQQS